MGRGGKQKRSLEEQVKVAVPAIISREIWDAAQTTRVNNRSIRRHKDGYHYLLKGHIYCDHCGHRLGGRTSHVGGKLYAYYRCNAYRAELVDECSYSSIHYPAATVDEVVWNWIASLLTDPVQLRDGLAAFQAEKEQHIRPLRTRLTLVQEMLESERAKLNRLLDLYLVGEFSKELLTERRGRLETRIASLEREELDTLAMIEAQTITDEQLMAIQEFGRKVATELNFARSNSEVMCNIINMLNLQVWLSTKDGERFALVRCGVGQEFLPLSSTATYDSSPCSSQPPSRSGPARFGRVRGRRQSRSGYPRRAHARRLTGPEKSTRSAM